MIFLIDLKVYVAFDKHYLFAKLAKLEETSKIASRNLIIIIYYMNR